MKTLRNILALFVLSVAFYSCDADATLDEADATINQAESTLNQANQTELNTNISADTGDQSNEVEEREG